MKYVLVGGAGFVAPRHMEAIKETGGNLLAIFDPFDSVGIIDTYFLDCLYFNDISRFERFCYKEKDNIDYIVICSPNFTHSMWCRFGLSLGFDIICEKPLVLTKQNFFQLVQAQSESKGKINAILQLRLSESLIQLKNRIKKRNYHHRVKIKYYTPRGKWYNYSWKGDVEKSGGLTTNIGVHLFDLMFWMFDTTHYIIKSIDVQEKCISGCIQLYKKTTLHKNVEVALVTFDLNINKTNTVQRKIIVDDIEVDFTSNFENLHTESYKKILLGEGFNINETFQARKLCEEIRKI